MIDVLPVTKLWKLAEKPDPEVFRSLKESLKVDDVIINLLIQRGINTFEAAKQFFSPGENQLHDPFLMQGMHQAVDRIEKAVSNQESILIFGDYDVDGTTSVALVYSYFKNIFPDRIYFHIPDRYEEGYGVSTVGIDRAASLGCKLIIALDCGIRSVDKVKYASEQGIDFIICDHHLPGDEIPDAVAVLDPKKSNCQYPFKELSGAGIGFKLIQAYNQINRIEESVLHYLDLVVLSIAADIVPIVGENRSLASLGLSIINSGRSKNIRYILSSREKPGSSPSTKEIEISDLVFKVAPLINAAGRINHGKTAVDLLLAETDQDLKYSLSKITEFNMQRVDYDKRMTDEALAILDSSPDNQLAASTVLYKEDWHKGVVGIVASRVMENYYRPTIILTYSKGVITGSARSVKGFDIHAAISKCSEFLEQFGGHQAAAGLTLLPENLAGFRIKFEEVVSQSILEEQKTEEVEIDIEIEPKDITPSLYKLLKRFSPFGPGNMSPVFLSRSVIDSGYAKIVGVKHLKMKLGKAGQPFYDAIAFSKPEFYDKVSNGFPIDVCYSLDENHWNGNVNLQWVVKDIRI
ncbi:MAG: single-stranded-DNA-specific exonuclease RecJ [Bacteroidia bacterium]